MVENKKVPVESITTKIILDSIADGVFTVDRDWNITSFNRAAEQITGISSKKAISQKCFDVFHANICQTACALRETLKTGRGIIACDSRMKVSQ
jgi:PAS domain S-box-containing protein